MIQAPGGPVAPAVNPRTQLLSQIASGMGQKIAAAGRDNMVASPARTDQGGMMLRVPRGGVVNTQSNAVSKAVANAAQMLLTRAVTKNAIQAAPVSEHGAGQVEGGAGSPANNFALQRLHQMVAAGLLAGMPSNMTDPAATWRTLSASMASNPDALQHFLAVIHGTRPGAAQGHVVNPNVEM